MDHTKATWITERQPRRKPLGFGNGRFTLRVGEDIPVAEALAVLQVRALDLEPEIIVHALW